MKKTHENGHWEKLGNKIRFNQIKEVSRTQLLQDCGRI